MKHPGDFNRLKTLLPLACLLAALAAVYLTGEQRVQMVNQTADEIRLRQERLRQMSVLAGDVVTAESALRGYLLTQDIEYLTPFKSAKDGARSLLESLKNTTDGQDTQAMTELKNLGAAMEAKFTQLDQTMLLTTDARRAALHQVHSDSTLALNDRLDQLERAVTERERAQLGSSLGRFANLNRTTQVLVAVEFAVVILLLLLAAKLLQRDFDRRSNLAEELEDLVRQRTAEIRALTDYAQRTADEVRHNLARELHDELGGILVALKIDLSQLEKRVDVRSEPQLARRWDNIQSGLAQAVELKRRVIEELHPSLLDTMGLAAAIRWLAEQFCERLGLSLRIDVNDPVPPLPPAESIQLFRIAQECLTNIGKHAKATQVEVTLHATSGEVLLEVADNGVGMTPSSESRPQSHGLRGMSSRAESLGGRLVYQDHGPGSRITVLIPRQSA